MALGREEATCMLTRATAPYGLPQAPRIPCCNLSSAKTLHHRCKHSPIGSGTRQHLVDTNNVERVDPHSHVEGLLTGGLNNVLVGANTSGLEGFRRKLLVLVGDEVAAEREVIDGSLLTTEIEDSDLGVGDTTVVSGFGEPGMSEVRR